MAKSFFNKKARGFAYGLFSLYLILVIISIPSLPYQSNQSYYLEIPPNCQEIRNFSKSCLGSTQEVQLPYFAVAPQTSCIFKRNFSLEKPSSYINFRYLDDVAEISIDNVVIGTFNNVWEPTTINYPLDEGHHNLSIDITNHINIGGIGQVLFCAGPLQ